MTQSFTPDRDIIMHARKSLLFSSDAAWMKKDGRGLFDVTMGCFDGAEICELVGTYALSKLADKFDNDNIGLYRDDGLVVLRDATGSAADRARKEICRIFKDLGLKITIDVGMKVVNYLDVTLNLADGTYRPYRKPNDTPMYVHTLSNHPPTIIKQIPKSISRRLTDISSNRDIFQEAAPLYNSALKASGYAEQIVYMEEREKEEKPQTKHHLVQSSVQQNRSHECRAKILTPRREAFPTSLTPKQNIQQ